MRTQQYRDRKRFVASTPVMKDGPISSLYAESDQRIYETPCPHCGEFFELTWATIQWPEGDTGAAYAVCPHNGCVIEESQKAAMVGAGRWRATAPHVEGHAGFLLRTLVSLNYNARWGQLAREFVAAKRDPETLRTFVNLVLAEGWALEGDGPDEHELAARAEPIGLDRMPAEILWLTAGCDVQDDRLEVAIVGHQRDGEAAVLGYRVLWGPVDGEEVWRELDDLLRETWPHPVGGARIGISAAAVDGSDGDHLPYVDGFCRGRFARRVVRIKGAPGFSRAPLQRSTQKGAPWFLVGVDAVKAALVNRLARPGTIRFSDSLEPTFYSQLCSERLVVRYSRGRPVRAFERVKGARAEALDGVTYALAVKGLIGQSLDSREAELSTPAAPKAVPRVARSKWMQR
jgi:phage terminase large subunit GpA-like protein